MKYRIGSVIIEAIDTYVRVTVKNIGGEGCPDRVRCTKNECPSAREVANLLAEIRGYQPDSAHYAICSRAANDAKLNKEAWEII